MTIKEAILKSLDDLNKLTNSMEVCDHILEKNYYDFGTAKTPPATVSALLGDFIRNGHSRVKRIKQDNGTYAYFLKFTNYRTHKWTNQLEMAKKVKVMRNGF